MRKTKKAGLARYDYHNREYLAVIREHDNHILLNQLRYDNEILKLPKEEMIKVEKPNKDELDMMTLKKYVEKKGDLFKGVKGKGCDMKKALSRLKL